MSAATAIRTYRAVGALAILVAITYQVAHASGGAHWSTVDYFSYFTELSNLFAAAILFSGALRGGAPRSKRVELLRGAAVLYMLTTGIVFAALLSGGKVATPWVNAIVHQIMPVVVALDWVLDPPRERLALRDTLLWLSFPLAYILYTLIRGEIVNWYPYFFVNPGHSGGYLAVLGATLAIGLGMIVMIALITWLGNARAASAGYTSPTVAQT